MDNRFQFVLLKMKAATLAVAMCIAPAVFADESVTTDISDINNEVFELGVFAGIINIEDFGSEFVPGIRLPSVRRKIFLFSTITCKRMYRLRPMKTIRVNCLMAMTGRLSITIC